MPRKMRHKYTALLLFGADMIFAPVSASLAGSEPSVAVKYEIHRHSVADALILFAEQSGEQIIFRYDETRNIAARELSGKYRPIDALVEILKDTGLKAYRNQDGIIVIRRDPDFKSVKTIKRNTPPFAEEKTTPVGASASAPYDRPPEELVITGSRLRRAELSAPNLVTTIQSETIKRTGTANIEELLNKLPQIVPSLTGSSNNPGEGIATVDLRGLGPERTLVLVNGRRYVPGNQAGIVDLNTIPTFLLDRVEVATGGTSAVYGSDAIAGVVNFKLRDDFDGFEGLARYRLSKKGDGDKYDLNLVYGQQFSDGRGSAFLHMGLLKRQPIFQGDRDFSAFFLRDSFIRPGSVDPRFGFGEYQSREDGGVPGLIASGSGAIPGGLVLGIPGSGPHPGLQRFGNDGEALAFNAVTDRFNFAPFNFLLLPQKRFMTTFGARYHLTDRVEIFNQVIFSRNRVDLELAPSPLIISDVEIPVENPFLADSSRAALRGIDWYSTGQVWQAQDANGNLLFDDQGTPLQARQALTATGSPLWAANGSPVAAVGAGDAENSGNLLFVADGRAQIPALIRRMTEIGSRQVKNNRYSLNIVAGVEGEMSQDWHFLLHYNYSRYKNTSRNTNAVSISKFRRAVDIIPSGEGYICRDETARQQGCVPANIFGEGNLSPEAIDYITTIREDQVRYVRQDITGYINGTIDHGVGSGVKLLFGADWRREDSSTGGDTIDILDIGGGFAPPASASGSYNILNIFGEAKMPLLENIPGFREFELSGALRYSDYSISGSVWSAAGGFNWRPFSDLRLRGQYQRAVREPNISNLFTSGFENFLIVSDPCAAGNISSYGDIRDICLATGVPANLIGNFVQTSNEVREIFNGNQNLGVEKSDTFTAGLVYQPSFLPALQMTVDYYHIGLYNQIGSFSDGVSGIIGSCFRENDPLASACEKIFRRSDGQLDFIDISLSNTGRTTTSGIDGQFFFKTPLDWRLLGDNEQLELVFQGSYLIRHDFYQTNDSNIIDCAGFFSGGCLSPLPKFRFVQMATWRSERLELSARWRHLGSIRNKNAVTENVAVARLPAKDYVDLYLQYRLTGDIIIRTGVDNIFNVTPDFVGTGQEQANTFPNIYDILGPYFHFGINVYY